MSDELPNKVVRIETLRINRDMKKHCTCINKTFTVDANNRAVYCDECGAWIQPYEAIEYLAKHYEKLQNETQSLLEQRKQIANYKPHLIVFRNLERYYREKTMVPTCPRCGEGFFFEEINHWINRAIHEARMKTK